MSESPQTHEQQALEESSRFAPPPTRRDFLGMAAIWSSVVAFAGALIGSMRLPMPSVFPESNASVKIGPAEAFAIDSATHLASLKLWVFRDSEGIYAVSSVCTHLGCIAGRDAETGSFLCPCHGSVFKADGSVVAGPAPSGLPWLALSIAPDGQIVVDQRRSVSAGTKLKV